MNEDFLKLEKKLNINFKNKNLLREAITHRSFLNETENKNFESNERLEFLGDAILSFWVSAKIFQKFPQFPEGKLTAIKTYLIRTETLAKLAKELSLGNFILLSRGEEAGGGRTNPVLFANCFEAIIGAIFSDQGIGVTQEFLEKQFSELISPIKDADSFKDAKSLLQEEIQAKDQPTPIYRLIEATGPDHSKTFTMAVFVGDKLLAKASGKSKQEAEEAAAGKALENILRKD